ncbi:MAG: hypothetical protein M1132_12020 [Chloroflexi bacterium]|nr:hypothetical protein [Chloroflexota bacterium]
MGAIVFLIQFRTHRAVAIVALVVAVFATLSLCGVTFLGGAFQVKPMGRTTALSGFPFPVGTTWVYSHSEYQQVIGDPTQTITATRIYTETVLRIEGSAPSLSFVQERTVSQVSAPPDWESWTVLNPGLYQYRMEGNKILEVHSSQGQQDLLLYDMPLAVGKSWCPLLVLPDNLPSCHMNGLRTVQDQARYTTPVGTFDDCYEIAEEYNSGGVHEWFCDGVGTVARKYDHSGTRFGYEDTLLRFTVGSPPR